jgi:hypothetical protein
MSKKITEAMLKGLVERVLSEKDLPIDVDYTTKGKIKGKRALKSDLGLSHKAPDYEKLAALADAGDDNDPATLSDKDFESAYNVDNKRARKTKSAEEIRSNTTDSTLKNTIDNIFSGSELDKKIQQAQLTAASNAQAAQQQRATEIKTISDGLKAETNIKKRIVNFKTAIANGGSIRGISMGTITDNMAEVFDQSFPDAADLLKIASYQQANDNSVKLPTHPSMTPIRTLLRNAVNNRIVSEAAGNITQKGYTRFVTPEVNGVGSLRYMYSMKDGKISKSNYNYTIFQQNPIEPWFISANDDNQSAIETLINAGTDDANNYLNNFLRKPTPKPIEDRIFFDNFKVFKTVIEEKAISVKNSDWWKKMVKDYASMTAQDPETKGGLKRTAITNPALMSQAAARGEMLDSQFQMFNTFFEGTPMTGGALNILSNRLKKLTDFTKELYDLGTTGTVTEVVNTNKTNWKLSDLDNDSLADLSVTNNKYVDLLNKIMVFDYFNAMAKELDSGSGAYLFETFCAYMAGGRVAGKEKGLKGGMGETDFFFDNGDKGSAKYLATTNKFSQSLGNFVQGVKVTYVFASKKGKKPIYDNQGELTGFDDSTEVVQTDPDLIHFIDLFVVDVERVEQAVINGKANFKITATVPNAQSETTDLEIDGTKVIFDVSNFKRAGRLYLVEKSKKSITTKLNALAKHMDGTHTAARTSFETLVKSFVKTFEHLESAQNKVSEYSNSGTKSLGTAAIEDMSDAQTEFKGVMDIIDPEQVRVGSLSESKKVTSSMLKKLIEENFKK